MSQQKPIFQIFKKSNMAAVMAIIIDNLKLKYRKGCTVRNLWSGSFSFSKIQKSMRWLESMGQIFFIFYMKLAYNGATKTHISNFQKIQHGRRYGDNYQ